MRKISFKFVKNANKSDANIIILYKGYNLNKKHPDIYKKLLNKGVVEKGEINSNFSSLTLVAASDFNELTVFNLNDTSVHGCKEIAEKIYNFLKISPHNIFKVLDTNLYSSVIKNIVRSIYLRNYSFDKYKTKMLKKSLLKESQIEKKISFEGFDSKLSKIINNELSNEVSSIFFARDLVSEPPNVLYPKEYAIRCKELIKLGLSVEVLNERKLHKLGMHSLLAVGDGSIKESQVIVIRWKNKNIFKPPVALIGKGVTFDTGGISIKPSQSMDEMKFDMAGSAAVVATMRLLALRNAKINAVGIIGCVENMPDGCSMRPGDVLDSMSGQTVEVKNTDAEGRLVLADLITYAQKKCKSKIIVNLATLTGAILVALGQEYAGLFSNDNNLAEKLLSASEEVDEKLWRMPLNNVYDKMINSDIADMQNIGGKFAGSITAAQFLKRFVQNDTKWAHIDIAGTAWAYNNKSDCPKGATGYGVMLLNRLMSEIENNNKI